jgi:hypothetical protein
MKVLFLDDSFLSSHTYQGYGGYCLDAENIGSLSEEIQALKRKKRIPWDVELKWSPSNKLKGSDTLISSSMKKLAIWLLLSKKAHSE